MSEAFELPPHLRILKMNDFAPYCESMFDMQTGGGEVPLKLVKVAPAGESGREGGAFALSFVAPRDRSLPQGTYPLKHPALGMMKVFLVPSGPVAGGIGYEATFA